MGVKKMATNGKDDILEAIAKMTVIELADLVKALEEKFGVSAVSFASFISTCFLHFIYLPSILLTVL